MTNFLLVFMFLFPARVESEAIPLPQPEPPPAYSEVFIAETSAYTSSIEETDADPFTTASGSKVKSGTLACPTRYKFGTKVLIEGKEYICEDRMNKRYRDGNHFDIWMADKSSALTWGRKSVEVKIR